MVVLKRNQKDTNHFSWEGGGLKKTHPNVSKLFDQSATSAAPEEAHSVNVFSHFGLGLSTSRPGAFAFPEPQKGQAQKTRRMVVPISCDREFL